MRTLSSKSCELYQAYCAILCGYYGKHEFKNKTFDEINNLSKTFHKQHSIYETNWKL